MVLLQTDQPFAVCRLSVEQRFDLHTSVTSYAVVGVIYSPDTPPNGREFEIHSADDYKILLAEHCVHYFTLGLASGSHGEHYVSLRCHRCNKVSYAPEADVMKWIRENYPLEKES